MEAGAHALPWDGTDARGARVSAGVYLYRLTAGGIAGARQIVMVR